MTTINKDDAIKAIKGLQYAQDGVLLIEFQYYNQALQDAIEAVRALPDAGPNIEYGRKHTDGSRAGGQPPEKANPLHYGALPDAGWDIDDAMLDRAETAYRIAPIDDRASVFLNHRVAIRAALEAAFTPEKA